MKITSKDDVGILVLEELSSEKSVSKKDKARIEDYKRGFCYKDITTSSVVSISDVNKVTNLLYADPIVDPAQLYALYQEDESIAGVIDKISEIASSEKISFGDIKESAQKKAEEVMKSCYLKLYKTKDGRVIRKRLMAKEFFKYLFTDYQIYLNCFFEVARSLDGKSIVFIYKDAKYMRVLKDQTGYVEIRGLDHYYYNNYSPIASERAKFNLHYNDGLKKEKELPIAQPYRREIVHIRGYGNEYYGLSKLYQLGSSSLMQINSKKLPNAMFRNGMINTPIITFSGASVSKENKKEIEDKFKYRALGTDKAGTPVILFTTTPNSEVKVDGMPKHDFTLTEVKDTYKLGESNVFKRLGVPPEKLSIVENSNRATIQEADSIMAEEVINPIQSLFEYQMNVIFNDDLKMAVDFKFSDKMYNMEKLAKVSRTVKGLTMNEIRTLILGVKKSEDENADKIYIGSTDKAIDESSQPGTITKDAFKKFQAMKDDIVKLLKERDKLSKGK